MGMSDSDNLRSSQGQSAWGLNKEAPSDPENDLSSKKEKTHR